MYVYQFEYIFYTENQIFFLWTQLLKISELPKIVMNNVKRGSKSTIFYLGKCYCFIICISYNYTQTFY